MKGLFDELGYTFTDDNLIKKALTHKSSSSDNNERLEFLGDAILNLYVSEKLIHSYPCLLYTSPSPRDRSLSRMPSSA